jgi:hypothetical protein
MWTRKLASRQSAGAGLFASPRASAPAGGSSARRNRLCFHVQLFIAKFQTVPALTMKVHVVATAAATVPAAK